MGKNQGAGWQKRKRTLGHKNKRSERSRQHTQFNARIDMHSKPSRTPGNVSYTILYRPVQCNIFTSRNSLRTLIVQAKPARCIRNPYCIILAGSGDNLNEKTRIPRRYRSTNDSVMKSEQISLVRGSDLPKCHSAHTSVGDM